MTEQSSTDKIRCEICGALTHAIQLHLKEDAHPGITIGDYQTTYPDAPLMSEFARTKLEAKKAQNLAARAATGVKQEPAQIETTAAAGASIKMPLADVFELGSAPAALNKRGSAIMVDYFTPDAELETFVPDIDPRYIFDIELTKTAIMGLTLNIPTYFWGMHGTGKTTAFEQICARTRRAWLRVQHTVNTEESHIVGQMAVRNGATVFDLGPLAYAMKHGLVYCADEYDFAMPSVLSVYQPVLEGKPLLIKEAPPDQRIIRPHPNFRFCATGNTNGGGDETGLYQGTQVQNAANYSRFGIVEEVQYMSAKQETLVVSSQSGIGPKEAEKIVNFANEIRTAHKGGRISSTISPRELITSAKLGLAKGSEWRAGLKLGFTNRCNRLDKEVIEQFAQRIFG